MLFRFTFLSMTEISQIIEKHNLDPDRQLAQKILAFEVTDLVHGPAASIQAQTKSAVLFDKDLESTTATQIEEGFRGDSRLVYVDRKLLIDPIALFVASSILPSKSSIVKIIKAAGFYVGSEKFSLDHKEINPDSLIDDRLLLLRTGKSNYRIVVLK
jgi:tyrosyl-tRNA synthetase